MSVCTSMLMCVPSPTEACWEENTAASPLEQHTHRAPHEAEQRSIGWRRHLKRLLALAIPHEVGIWSVSSGRAAMDQCTLRLPGKQSVTA